MTGKRVLSGGRHLQVLAVQDRLQVLAVHVSAHAVLLGHLELPVAVLQPADERRHALAG